MLDRCWTALTNARLRRNVIHAARARVRLPNIGLTVCSSTSTDDYLHRPTTFAEKVADPKQA